MSKHKHSPHGDNVSEIHLNPQECQQMLQRAPVGICKSSPEGYFLQVNPTLARMFGFPSTAAMVESVSDIAGQLYVDPEDRREIQRLLEEQGQVENYECPMLRRDSSQFWGSFSAETVKDQQGRSLYYFCFLFEITGRRQAEKAQYNAEQKFQVLADKCPISVMLFDEQGRVDFVNEWHIEKFAHNKVGKEYFLGKSVHELPGLVNAGVDVEVARIFQGEAVEFSEVYFPEFAVGGSGWVSIRAVPIYQENSIAGGILIRENITAKKQIEAALRKSQQKFRSLVESVQDMLFAHTLEGHFTYLSPQVTKILGYESHELIGRNFQDIIHPQDLPYTLRHFQEALENNQVANEIEHRVLHKNGEYRWLYVSVTLLINPDGNADSVVGVARDITEHKHMEKRLKEMSITDSLTGLYNRNFFEEEMKRLSDGRYFPLGIIVCDLDAIKLINDTLGHQAGDALLKKTAHILRHNFRSSDIVARIGGDEFAVLLPQAESGTMQRMLKQVRQAVQEYNSTEPGLPLALSLGHTECNAPADLQTLFREADDRMYREKVLNAGCQRSAILQALTQTMQARDFDTQGHCDHLQKLSTSLARSLGHSLEFINTLCLLARFHDLGKIGIPEHFLFKQGTLTEEEREKMRQHCEIGHRIASSFPDLKSIADLILKHHEHWDGTGYPLGLQGEEIPIECRILAIVDAYDAMTSDRPYRKAMSCEDALSELKRCAGTQFAPGLVEQFIQMMEAFDWECGK